MRMFIIDINKVKLFWIVLCIGPEVFLLAHPKASNFELKSPTNMTLSERLLRWSEKVKNLGFHSGSKL